MENLTKEFERRVTAFLRRTGLSASEFGERAVGDRKFVGVAPENPGARRVRVAEELRAYEAATAQADPLDPTTKYFLNWFVDDFHSRRRATAQEHWTRSRRDRRRARRAGSNGRYGSQARAAHPEDAV